MRSRAMAKSMSAQIAGSYSNVVGLPLAETRLLLKVGGLSDCLNG